MTRRTWAIGLLVLAMGVLGGCVSVAPAPPEARWHAVVDTPEEWVRTELFIGMTRRDGAAVTPEQWQRFEALLVATFLDGFNVLSADGLWMETRGNLRVPHREPSRIVVLCYPKNKAMIVNVQVGMVCRAALATLDQETVLRSDAPAMVSSVHRTKTD